jgi:tRNA (adenine57-N1/adenine58-N1)-methyltransferase
LDRYGHDSPIQEGELLIFQDTAGKKELKRVTREKTIKIKRYRNCKIDPQAVIGKMPGSEVSSISGKRSFTIYRPTLKDYIMTMPRKSNIIYPKDIGIILMWADIFPGAKVLTAGVGSGALMIALLEVAGPSGLVLGYDNRMDMLEFARENIINFFGEGPLNMILRNVDIYEGIPDSQLDRAVIDVPEPWKALGNLADALKPSGLVAFYLPSTNQVEKLQQEMENFPQLQYLETLEVLVRKWHVQSPSVRPEHQMVGHTGFLTFARRLSKNSNPDFQSAL